MTRMHLHRSLASIAVLLLSAAAAAQSSKAAAPAQANAAPAAQHATDKAKGDKADAPGKADDPTANDADRAARVKAQHEAEAAQLRAVLRAPITEPQKQELRRHAQRVARLERIRTLATDAKDTATVDRATKLLVKENTRHEKWLASLSTKTDAIETPTGPSQAKGGAQ